MDRDGTETLHWALDKLLCSGSRGMTLAELKEASDDESREHAYILPAIQVLGDMRVVGAFSQRDGLSVLTVLDPSLAHAMLTGSWPFGPTIAVSAN